ncbi:MAG: hypothetical protein AABY22_18640 [Nanoarchaeota archaeon]
MKKEISKWRLVKVEVIRDGVLDVDYSGYELQKEGIALCKFSEESLKEVKEFLMNFLTP